MKFLTTHLTKLDNFNGEGGIQLQARGLSVFDISGQ
jgi:hypothetical protein